MDASVVNVDASRRHRRNNRDDLGVGHAVREHPAALHKDDARNGRSDCEVFKPV